MESVNESRQPNTEFGSRLLSRRKTVKMLVTIVVVFALCFLPNHTLSILTYMEKLRGIPNLRIQIPERVPWDALSVLQLWENPNSGTRGSLPNDLFRDESFNY
ncbi:hypothetical protein MAR_026766 [Mya arenaria]|uniref:Uncharacterized protein n=1 Tax=Mya arenaria TaxID=6604 RepID=A0ABY7EUT2_MYAAR|nr:hypothetical protein MAR_026766 [Mya arenaria]